MFIQKISKEALTKMGSNSLIGMLTAYPQMFERLREGLDTDLRIEFEETSTEWKKQHGGPDEIIIPEYVPGCLVRDIIYLCRQYPTLSITVAEYELSDGGKVS
jgi:hypothetical protein